MICSEMYSRPSMFLTNKSHKKLVKKISEVDTMSSKGVGVVRAFVIE